MFDMVSARDGKSKERVSLLLDNTAPLWNKMKTGCLLEYNITSLHFIDKNGRYQYTVDGDFADYMSIFDFFVKYDIYADDTGDKIPYIMQYYETGV